jgi:hypothetical protein
MTLKVIICNLYKEYIITILILGKQRYEFSLIYKYLVKIIESIDQRKTDIKLYLDVFI